MPVSWLVRGIVVIKPGLGPRRRRLWMLVGLKSRGVFTARVAFRIKGSTFFFVFCYNAQLYMVSTYTKRTLLPSSSSFVVNLAYTRYLALISPDPESSALVSLTRFFWRKQKYSTGDLEPATNFRSGVVCVRTTGEKGKTPGQGTHTRGRIQWLDRVELRVGRHATATESEEVKRATQRNGWMTKSN